MEKMKKIIRLFAIIAAIFCFAACDPEKETITPEAEPSIVYIVTNTALSTTPISVNITTDEELDALLDQFCNYAQGGNAVTFYNTAPRSSSAQKVLPKEATTFSTTNREEMKRWMARMEDEGMTVTVTYDSSSGTWHGTAYATAPQTMPTEGRHLSRATLNHSFNNINYGWTNIIYTYTWNGDLLTTVNIEEERSYHYTSNGQLIDTVIVTHSSASLSYNNGLRSEIQFFDENGSVTKTIQYSYLNGRLAQEWHSDNKVYTFIYNNEGFLDHWLVTDQYTYPSSYYCSWNNGDMVSGALTENGETYCTAEYDNHPHPFGVTLGTTTLLPWYDVLFAPEVQWSQHNMTHYIIDAKSQGYELWINYTYNGGSPVTAETLWYNGGNASWTFEYYDQ